MYCRRMRARKEKKEWCEYIVMVNQTLILHECNIEVYGIYEYVE